MALFGASSFSDKEEARRLRREILRMQRALDTVFQYHDLTEKPGLLQAGKAQAHASIIEAQRAFCRDFSIKR